MPISIYIHIPFCLKKCDYCDFNSTSPETIPEEEYTDCLIHEIRSITETLYDEKPKVKSVYFGGGTPSLFSADSINSVLSTVRELYNIKEEAEITLEVNPKTADYEKLAAFRAIGVNRLSIGTQSFDDRLLKILGRVHDSDDALRTFKDARRAGFDNINLDLIFAIPTQTDEMLESDLKIITELEPEHISAYMLTVERGTPLFERIQGGALTLDDDIGADMFLAMEERLTRHGYDHYEISAYAKSGLRSVHNENYWRSGEYIGFGAAAHSMVKSSRAAEKFCETKEFYGAEESSTVRWYNLADHIEYMESVKSTGRGMKGAAPIDEQQRMTEFLIMGMRLLDGIRLGDFKSEFGRELTEVYDEKVAALIDAGLIEIVNNNISAEEKISAEENISAEEISAEEKILKLTKKGVLLSNEVLVNLI